MTEIRMPDKEGRNKTARSTIRLGGTTTKVSMKNSNDGDNDDDEDDENRVSLERVVLQISPSLCLQSTFASWQTPQEIAC